MFEGEGFRRTHSGVVTDAERQARRLVGSIYDDMLADHNYAVSCLHHESLDVRRVALSLLSDHWIATPETINVVREYVRHAEPELQVTAINTLAIMRCQCGDATVSSVMAEFIASHDISDRTRAKLYSQLKVAFGDAELKANVFQTPQLDTLTLEQIDPSVIERCLKHDTTSALMPKQQDSERVGAIELHRQACSLFAEGHTSEAKNLFLKSADIWPTPPTLIMLARLYRKVGDMNAALQAVSRAISLTPDAAALYRERSVIQREMGRILESEQDTKRANDLERRD